MRGQRLLVHVVRVRSANLQLDDQVDEDRLVNAEVVLCRELLVFVILDRLCKRSVDEAPPVHFSCLSRVPLTPKNVMLCQRWFALMRCVYCTSSVLKRPWQVIHADLDQLLLFAFLLLLVASLLD